jgi:hypothetical protein
VWVDLTGTVQPWPILPFTTVRQKPSHFFDCPTLLNPSAWNCDHTPFSATWSQSSDIDNSCDNLLVLDKTFLLNQYSSNKAAVESSFMRVSSASPTNRFQHLFLP